MTQQSARAIGHGNAQFLADMQEPGITRDELRARARANRYPHLWQGADQWLRFKGFR